MILHINDSTNSAKPLYYQSLVLLYLPCEKFGAGDSDNHLFIDAYAEEGFYHAKVRLVVGMNSAQEYANEKVVKEKYSQMKNLIGRTFLRAAYKLFGFMPPWGISTGVKPVKLARKFVEDFGEIETLRILTNEYMISESKARMAVSGCLFEENVIKDMGQNPFSLYVSIPFCPTKCNYCSFVSCTTQRLLSLIPEYLNKLDNELSVISETTKELGLNLKSVYIGGGTPAIIDVKQIENLLLSINRKFGINNCEFTFEAGRPDCITYDKLKVLRDFGVDRISINTQTTNDEILKAVGRNHSFADYLKAMECAKSLDFKCVNTDLIAGLPGESADSFKQSVRDVASLCPENITVHAFTLKKSSNYRISGETDFSTEYMSAIQMTEFAADYLDSAAYKPYYVYRQKNTVANLENVGYSLDGFESIYNIIMMGEYHTVFGAGAGSVTKIVSDSGCKVDRIFAPKYPYEFLDNNKYSGLSKTELIEMIKEG